MAGTVNSRSPIKIKTMDEEVTDPRKNLRQLCIFKFLLRLPYLHTCPSSTYPDLPRLSDSLLLCPDSLRILSSFTKASENLSNQ